MFDTFERPSCTIQLLLKSGRRSRNRLAIAFKPNKLPDDSGNYWKVLKEAGKSLSFWGTYQGIDSNRAIYVSPSRLFPDQTNGLLILPGTT